MSTLLMSTPLHRRLFSACTNGRLEEVIDLVEVARVDCNFQDPITKETALMKATERNHIDVVKYLLSRGANMYNVDWMGWTAYTVAAVSGFKELSLLFHQIGNFVSVPYVPNTDKKRVTR